MQLRRSERITPDGSVKWRRRELRDGTLYLSDDAPVESESHLTSPHIFELGPRIGEGRFAEVRGNGEVAIKRSRLDPFMDPEVWKKYAGMGAVKMNVALQKGMERLGGEARLSSGALITTPKYLGAFTLRRSDAVIVLMTQELGREPNIETDALTIGTQASRRVVYDAAMDAVGFDPREFKGYDDKRDNLLVRQFEGSGAVELVKLDACDRVVIETDW
jgi:hypothetical protein